MNKTYLVELLRQEIKNLHYVIECIEDDSALCIPDCYDCSHCLSEIVAHLSKTTRILKKTPCLKKQNRTDSEREWLALK